MGRPPRISREQILESAREVFTARGFAATTLADIAQKLRVTPAAILRHFPSKQDLFAAAMSARAIEIPPFIAELARVDATADPRGVLRHFAEQFVPFMSTIIRSAIAVQMHLAARQTTLVVPFDTHAESTPPRRVLAVVSDYFRRAIAARTIRRGDPRAYALLFLGQLQSYVFIHQILAVTPAVPLEDYLDALVVLWTGGALAVKTKRSAPRRGGARSPGRDRGGAAVRAQTTRAETARPRRNARSADGERRVARRRPRHPRPRR
jgi:AcrR family transcriptional regulator